VQHDGGCGERNRECQELLAQLQQLAEDDLGVAGVHEVWEQITDYER
jgi:hypothetical protein